MADDRDYIDDTNIFLSRSKSDSIVRYSDYRIIKIINQDKYVDDIYPSNKVDNKTDKPNNAMGNKIKISKKNSGSTASNISRSTSCKY